jgi:hypothetical protein
MLKEMDKMDWIDLVMGRDQWMGAVNIIMKPKVS